jgi:hypothetical protein
MMSVFCTNCGKPVSDDDTFCRACGHKLENGHSELKNKPDPAQRQSEKRDSELKQKQGRAQGNKTRFTVIILIIFLLAAVIAGGSWWFFVKNSHNVSLGGSKTGSPEAAGVNTRDAAPPDRQKLTEELVKKSVLPEIESISSEDPVTGIYGVTSVSLKLNDKDAPGYHVFWSSSCGEVSADTADILNPLFVAPAQSGTCRVTADIRSANMLESIKAEISIVVTEAAGREAGYNIEDEPGIEEGAPPDQESEAGPEGADGGAGRDAAPAAAPAGGGDV